MKKYSLLIITLLQGVLCFGQIETTLPQVTRPMPSAGTLMNFAEIPINTFTGVPDIAIPLYSFPTRSKDINVNLALSYHPAGISFVDRASDVGVGWNLTGAGAVSRTVVNEPDERYNTNTSLPNYYVNAFDDMYSYNALGISGRFKIIRNTTNNTFSIQMMDNSTCKIEFDMDPVTFRLNSFTIYDDKGYKYFFDKKDSAYGKFWTKRILPNVPSYETLAYVSAHYLTKVYDNNGKELVNYNYNTFTRSSPTGGGNDSAIKLSSIVVEGIGKAEFDYYYSNLLDSSLSDPLQLNALTIKDLHLNTIKKYAFNYGFSTLLDKERRFLGTVTEYDKVLATSKNYNLTYKSTHTNPYICTEDYVYGTDLYGYLNLAPKYDHVESDGYMTDPVDLTVPEVCTMGSLESMTLPTGGKISYEFESNTVAATTDPNEYLIYDTHATHELNNDNFSPTVYASTSFSTSTNMTWQFTVTGSVTKKLFLKFTSTPYTSPLSDPVDKPLYPGFSMLVNGIPANLENKPALNNYACLGRMVELAPGTYTITISKLTGTVTTGTITVTENVLNTPLKGWVYKGGVRIKKIAHYESALATTASKEMNYNYQKFDDANISSGEISDGYWAGDFTESKLINPQVNYMNVKVYDTGNNGYTKYYYKSFTELT